MVPDSAARESVTSGSASRTRPGKARFGGYTGWAYRIQAAEKPERPLGAQCFGPRLVATQDGLDGISRSKIYEVVLPDDCLL